MTIICNPVKISFDLHSLFYIKRSAYDIILTMIFVTLMTFEACEGHSWNFVFRSHTARTYKSGDDFNETLYGQRAIKGQSHIYTFLFHDSNNVKMAAVGTVWYRSDTISTILRCVVIMSESYAKIVNIFCRRYSCKMASAWRVYFAFDFLTLGGGNEWTTGAKHGNLVWNYSGVGQNSGNTTDTIHISLLI
jgi:hypothetical protein